MTNATNRKKRTNCVLCGGPTWLAKTCQRCRDKAKQADPCKHCHERIGYRSRGLCSRCYRSEKIRRQYPAEKAKAKPSIDNDDFVGDLLAVVLVDLPCRRCGAMVQIDADVLEETQNQNVECPLWCERKGA